MGTITLKHWRGTYLARLTINDRETFDRDWSDVSEILKLKGAASQRRYSGLEPGWYESREGYRMHKGAVTPKQYWRVTETQAEPIDFEALCGAITGPLPGEDGEYGSDKCECGLEVVAYDVDGYPRCKAHELIRDLADSFPVPA